MCVTLYHGCAYGTYLYVAYVSPGLNTRGVYDYTCGYAYVMYVIYVYDTMCMLWFNIPGISGAKSYSCFSFEPKMVYYRLQLPV